MKQVSDADFGCRKCGKTVTLEQFKSSRFCPNCGTMLRPLRCWIFQFNPAVYLWHDWIKENGESKYEQWLVSQHAREIHKGDRVAIWASGERAGIYALGEILEEPRIKPLSLEQQKYWIKKEDIKKFEEKKSTMVRYLKSIIDNPLLEEACRKDNLLKNMEILKHPQGTNFYLDKEHWKRIVNLTSENTI